MTMTPPIKILPTLLVLLFVAFPACGAAQNSDAFLSVAEASSLVKKDSKAIFVDIRSSKDFEKIRIPTSINIAAHFIKTKKYLQKMKVILVDQGYNPETLLRLSDSLRNLGFSSTILAGGLTAWQQQGKKLSGDTFGDINLNLMPPSSLFANKTSPYFKLFVDIGQKTNAKIVPQVIKLDLKNKKATQRLIAAIKSRDLDEKSGVLVYNQEGDYSKFGNLVSQCKPAIFFLEGGLKKYQKFISLHEAMLKPRQERIEKIGGCATCPPNSEKPEEKE